jgi:hypothetical protein
MNDAIELLCQKLGTTLDKLVPTVIKFGIHDAKMFLVISIFMLAIGISLIITGVDISNHIQSLYSDDDLWTFMCEFGGAILSIIGLIIMVMHIVKLHYWNAFPELQAYQTILRWVGGK